MLRNPAIETYVCVDEHPFLNVPQFIIARAVKQLGKIEALALIRGAYQASLQDARMIYADIIQEEEQKC